MQGLLRRLRALGNAGAVRNAEAAVDERHAALRDLDDLALRCARQRERWSATG